MNTSYITGELKHHDTVIPQVSPELKSVDFWGAVMVRWGFRRDKCKVNPGRYENKT